ITFSEMLRLILYSSVCFSCCLLFFFFFFFSSRRRHTRSTRDWSSDVCSSDLEAEYVDVITDAGCREVGLPTTYPVDTHGHEIDRSEERRVGKECRCRWSP